MRSAVEAALVEAGRASTIAGAERLGGGCVSPAARLRMVGGGCWFVKWGDARVAAEMFRAEAAALAALAATGAVRVPDVAAIGPGWLLLEWLEPGPSTAAAWHALGGALAQLHRGSRGAAFGWAHDNFIGPLPQSNGAMDGWPAFWLERRLAPQLERALRGGRLAEHDRTEFGRLFAQLDELLAVGDAEGASLLHGDLWSGNVQLLAGGGAALIDPSSYYGHREVDLAMAALFGGFDDAFEEAYTAAWPLSAGHARRRAIYQLYYLLVHVNLFGAGYVPQTRSVLARALSG